MDWEQSLPLILALGGGGGIGAGLTAAISAARAVIRGVSATNGKRKLDLVRLREVAETKATAEEARADWAENNARIAHENETRAREHAAELRLLLMDRGSMMRADLPPWPTMEDTIPRSKLVEILRQQAKAEEAEDDRRN